MFRQSKKKWKQMCNCFRIKRKKNGKIYLLLMMLLLKENNVRKNLYAYAGGWMKSLIQILSV